ncbi:MAG: DUF1376 domain-containing protein [Solirubrobacterales bacterium]|nr:DUF1376 domain-containing protein [Solirubrobacterales bacterium]
MQLNLDEFDQETVGLLVEQLGAAWRMLRASWHQEPPCTLPNDPRVLATVSQLGARWKTLGAALLLLWVPREDGRLHWPWLTRTYGDQLARYEKRSRANAANRAKRGQAGGEATNRSTNRSATRTTNRRTDGSTNGATKGERIVVPLSRENLELRRSPEGSDEPSRAPAPDARASAGGARAALGASEGESVGAPSDDSDPGRAVDTRRGGAVLRPSVVQELERALAWASENHDRATAVELTLHDDPLWAKAKPKQRESMLISAFVKEMHESATNGGGKMDPGTPVPVPEEAER